jgi:ribosomal protein L33
MAWQKNKICLMSTEVDPVSGKKVIHRYLTRKSKGKNKAPASASAKLTRRKYNPVLRKHVTYTETKIQWR